jgi:CubicO group peptidase (beta-lactamase class C family)
VCVLRKVNILAIVTVVIIGLPIPQYSNFIPADIITFNRRLEADHPFEIQETPRDYFPTYEWRMCEPEEQGMNSTRLSEMMSYIDDSNWPIDSIIIVRGGYIVWEDYLSLEYNMDYFHTQQSVSKSFASALVGIAIEQGLFRINDAIVDLFSDRNITGPDERKEHMTIWHLLTMTAGVEWDEWTYPYTDTENNNLAAMVTAVDAVDYFLNLPMAYEPGEHWVYNSGATIILGVLIEKFSNQTLVDFTEEYLFNPIGIPGCVWQKTLNDVYQAGGGLWLKPRDMARFGYLYLNGGNWNGTQVVTEEWILNSTDYQFDLPPSLGYGYLWWLDPTLDVYEALGRFGQRIMVSTEEDMVVVFTASIRGENYHPHPELYRDYILDSIVNPPRPVTQTTPTDQSTTSPDYPEISELGLGLFLTSIAIVAIAVFIITRLKQRV